MTVRDKAGRRRFILFEIPGDPDAGMGRLITLFNNRFRDLNIDRRDIRFRVVFVGEGIGVVRCSHLAKDDVLNMINSTILNGEQLSTVKTSGTLRTLKDWLKLKRGIELPGKTRGLKRKRMNEGPAGNSGNRTP